MSARLHVVLSDEEHARFKACAEAEGVSFSTWVRMALDLAERGRPRRSAGEKLEALQQVLDMPAEARLPMPPIDEYRAWHGATRYGDLPAP